CARRAPGAPGGLRVRREAAATRGTQTPRDRRRSDCRPSYERIFRSDRARARQSGFHQRVPGGLGMPETMRLLAADLGAETGRAVVGSFVGDRIALEEVH